MKHEQLFDALDIERLFDDGVDAVGASLAAEGADPDKTGKFTITVTVGLDKHAQPFAWSDSKTAPFPKLGNNCRVTLTEDGIATQVLLFSQKTGTEE